MLSIQLQQAIRNQSYPLHIAHIQSHTGLPVLLAQGREEIDQLLIRDVLEVSNFHENHHVNIKKGLMKKLCIT